MSRIFSFLLFTILMCHTNQVQGNEDDERAAPFEGLKPQNEYPEDVVLKDAKGAALDINRIMQPSYVCDSESKSVIKMAAWHYSCKRTCNIDAGYKIVHINLYNWISGQEDLLMNKITASKVCYTSHENMWGNCVFTQTTEPADITEANIKSLQTDIDDFDLDGGIIHKYIIRSGHPNCSYWADLTKCENDYKIERRYGDIIWKDDNTPPIVQVRKDSIKADLSLETVLAGPEAWVWHAPHGERACHWERGKTIQCRFIERSHILECPSIGYTYSLRNLNSTTTCEGKLYDIHGPFPFRFSRQNDGKSKSTVVSAKKDADKDKSYEMDWVDSINNALSQLENAYCSSMCEMISGARIKERGTILDTPIGSWMYTPQDRNGFEHMTPCSYTSDWIVGPSTSVCGNSNYISVTHNITKEITYWDVSKEWITPNITCDIVREIWEGNFRTTARLISAGIPISLSFWNGEVITVLPPYTNFTVKSYIGDGIHRASGWASQVKINPNHWITSHDVGNFIVIHTSGIADAVKYQQVETKQIHHMFYEEVLSGASNVTSSIYDYTVGGFLSLKKIILVSFSVLILIVLLTFFFRIYALLRTVFKNKHNPSPQIRRGSEDSMLRRVSWHPSVVDSEHIEMENHIAREGKFPANRYLPHLMIRGGKKKNREHDPLSGW